MLHNLLNEEGTGHSVDEAFDLIKIILENDDFVNCYNLDSTTANDSLDRTLLFTLIKCNSTDPIDQLMIALKFGRIDVVSRQILDDGCYGIRSSVNRGKLVIHIECLKLTYHAIYIFRLF